jgi:phosphoribosylformimino-5-aminoimidazole carboxamide ribotide isomerase
MDQETVYFEDPVDAAKHWLNEGASFLHIVDLNGAVEGRPVHTKEVAAICRQPGLSVELGGGLRSIEAVQAAFDLGVARVVIGRRLTTTRSFCAACAENFPARLSSASTRARQGCG